MPCDLIQQRGGAGVEVRALESDIGNTLDVGDELLLIIEGSIKEAFSTFAASSLVYRPKGCVHALTVEVARGLTQ
jgi:hypothetical protein